MRKTWILGFLVAIAISATATAHDAKKGEKVVSGTIAKLDTANHAMTVTDAKGTSWEVQWTDSTKVQGGELKEGAAVQLGCTESDSKHWATWIKVSESRQ
jgi:general stress protein 26